MSIEKDAKIFITGANGFLGRYIVNHLVSLGYTNLFCLARDLKHIQPLSSCIKWIEGDILDMPLMFSTIEGMDVVIHSAAEVTFELKKRKTIIEAAKDGSSNIVNACLEAHVKKLIVISSVSALGRKKDQEEIDESSIFSHSAYDTSYSLAKFLSEQEAWRGHAEGLNTTILCPSTIIGIGDWNRSSPKIFKTIAQGLKFYPSGSTGWVAIQDVVKAVELCISKDFSGERFIISAENHTFKNVFELISNELKVACPTIEVNLKNVKYFQLLSKIQSFFGLAKSEINSETLISKSLKSYYNNTKSREILGLQYSPIPPQIKKTALEFLRSTQNNF